MFLIGLRPVTQSRILNPVDIWGKRSRDANLCKVTGLYQQTRDVKPVLM